jgi:hypothetical protein
MPFMREQDAISGKQAKAFATINGRVEELFYAKSIEATIEKNKVDVPVDYIKTGKDFWFNLMIVNEDPPSTGCV